MEKERKEEEKKKKKEGRREEVENPGLEISYMMFGTLVWNCLEFVFGLLVWNYHKSLFV